MWGFTVLQVLPLPLHVLCTSVHEQKLYHDASKFLHAACYSTSSLKQKKCASTLHNAQKSEVSLELRAHMQ